MHKTGRSALTGVKAGLEDHGPLSSPVQPQDEPVPRTTWGRGVYMAAFSCPTRPHVWSAQKSDTIGKPEWLTFPERKYAIKDSTDP